MNGIRILITLALCSAAFGQFDGVSVTASRSVSLPPGQAFFQISVLSDPASTLDQVLAAVHDGGVTAQNLLGVSPGPPTGPPPAQPRANYQFLLAVPYASLRETADKLEKIRRAAILDGNLEIQYFAAGISAQSASIDDTRQRLLPELIEDARTKAQAVATAAHLGLGRILAVNDLSTLPPAGVPTPLTLQISISVRFALQ